MRGGLDYKLLKGVSRSFYLSLKLLPKPMRPAACVGYLLARTSDTLADVATSPLNIRANYLTHFGQAVSDDSEAPRWSAALLNSISNVKEKHLLEGSNEVLSHLRALPEAEAGLVRDVVRIIISGQALDLQRFGSATRESPRAFKEDNELEDYAWRVAGSVGAFWTKLGFLTLGESFSTADKLELLEKGIAYGKGLQLVNILRDVAADFEIGRCYLPVTDLANKTELMSRHRYWQDRARTWLTEGERYARTLRSRRLRAATVLPAMIAQQTLAKMEEADWEGLQERIKIPRTAVYTNLLRSFF